MVAGCNARSAKPKYDKTRFFEEEGEIIERDDEAIALASEVLDFLRGEFDRLNPEDETAVQEWRKQMGVVESLVKTLENGAARAFGRSVLSTLMVKVGVWPRELLARLLECGLLEREVK